MSARPCIALTRSRTGDTPGRPRKYLEALSACGASAEYIDPCSRAAEIVRRHQGVLIPGGRDLPPSWYGEETVCSITAEDPGRSAFERDLILEARMAKKPVFGICYGMQLMNVVLGGTLFQDIAAQAGPGSLDHREGLHEVAIVANPYLPAGSYRVNSSHHQAVRTAGRGLSVIAEAPDGIAEAVCAGEGPFFVGVQWHPERTDDPLSKTIFAAFAQACRD
ncbi:MAG: hypothetical protein OHK006_00400 [Thermodesulfovibrionales bacterium]